MLKNFEEKSVLLTKLTCCLTLIKFSVIKKNVTTPSRLHQMIVNPNIPPTPIRLNWRWYVVVVEFRRKNLFHWQNLCHWLLVKLTIMFDGPTTLFSLVDDVVGWHWSIALLLFLFMDDSVARSLWGSLTSVVRRRGRGMGESPMHADSPNHHLKASIDTPFPRAFSRDYDPVTTPFDPSSSSADNEYISELNSAQLSFIHTTFVWSLDEPDTPIKPDDIFLHFLFYAFSPSINRQVVFSSLRSAHDKRYTKSATIVLS